MNIESEAELCALDMLAKLSMPRVEVICLQVLGDGFWPSLEELGVNSLFDKTTMPSLKHIEFVLDSSIEDMPEQLAELLADAIDRGLVSPRWIPESMPDAEVYSCNASMHPKIFVLMLL